MLSNISISSYQDTKSFIHKLNSIEKLLSLVLFIILSLQTNSIYYHIVYFILLLIFILISKVPFRSFLLSLRSVFYLLIFLFLINFILNMDLITNIVNILRIIEIVLFSSLITLTTKDSEMLEGIIFLLKPLKLFKVNINILGQLFSLTLKFIPCIIDCINKIILSLKAKGINFRKKKLLILRTIIIPTFYLTIKKADDLALSLEARKYNMNKHKKVSTNKWRIIDSLIISVLVILIIEVIICDI